MDSDIYLMRARLKLKLKKINHHHSAAAAAAAMPERQYRWSEELAETEGVLTGIE